MAITQPAAPTVAPRPAAGEPQPIVVIPALDEEGRVGDVVRGVREAMPAATVLVVDDGSTDATAREARAAGARVLPLPLNLGYGAALQAGYKYAIRGGFDPIAQLDADGQHEPAQLTTLLGALADSDCDVVIGSRFLDRDGHYEPGAARKAGMFLFSRLASAATRQHVSDPTSGFQVMRAGVARFFCTEVYPSDYPDSDILILLNRSGYRVREVPVQMRPSPGASMHGGHHSLYYTYKMLLSSFVTLLRRT